MFISIIKETLLQRAAVLEEHHAAVKTTINKRRQIERLKGSSNIRPDKVDEALEELEEVRVKSSSKAFSLTYIYRPRNLKKCLHDA